MSLPKEGSRDVDDGIIISMAPDIRIMPDGARIPFSIWARQSEAANLVNSVRLTDMRAHAKDSLILHCYDMESKSPYPPNTGLGVKSGTVGSVCTPKTWSETVLAEGRNMVRHTDEWWMNNKNTYGKLIYTKDMGNYNLPEVPLIGAKIPDPGKDDGTKTLVASASSINMPRTVVAQAIPFIDIPFEEEIIPKISPQLGPKLAPRIPPRLAPDLGPEPGPEPQPAPYPIPPGLRISGCRREEICFDAGKYDEKEYRRQLKLQQNAINGKPACQNVKDIADFDKQDDQGKKDQRKKANDFRDNIFMRKFLQQNQGISLQNKAAIHRLDMVAGGSETDFAGIGDSKINSSIGPAWNAESRKGKLKTYAADMCAKGCRMSVTLDICETPEYGVGPESA